MISLKAISTLRKKSKFLLLSFIILLLSASSLKAESFRVTVQGDNESYISLFESVLSSFSSVSSDKVISLRDERREREEKRAKMKRISQESRNEKKSEENVEKSEEYSILSLEVVIADFSPYSTFLSSSDEDAYLYLRAVNSIDGIFYITSRDDGDISFISVLFNGEHIHSAWYNTATAESEEDVIYNLLASLLLGNGYHLYEIETEPADATLMVDGIKADGDSRYMILPDGEHTFTLSGYGYRDEAYVLTLSGESDILSFVLAEEERFPLLVTTYPYSASLYFNGVKSEKKYLDSVALPYVITLENDGFEDYSYQERRSYSHLTLHMAPSWMEGKDILEEKKSAFYSSLFYVLVSFGGYCASQSISTFYSETVGNASRIVFTGATILSLVNLMQNAVDYYNTAATGL